MEKRRNDAFDVKIPLIRKGESVYAAKGAIGTVVDQSLNGGDYLAVRRLSQYCK
jgi:hypothetical protein